MHVCATAERRAAADDTSPRTRSGHRSLRSYFVAVRLCACPVVCCRALRLVTDSRHSRLVDEVVAQFEYAGAIAFDGVEYAGQGAVKRCLSDLFLGSGGGGGAALGVGGRSAYDVSFSALGDAASSSPHGGFVTRAHVAPSDHATAASSDHAAASVREFELRATLNAAGLIRRMVVTSLADPSAELHHSLDRDDDAGETTLLSASGGTRPKWETYDGRVRQRIWQHSGAFSLGNPFLVETLELTTGRLICVVDKNVWRCAAARMRRRRCARR